MNTNTHRSTAVFGSLLLIAAAALTGCASTGGGVTSSSVRGQAPAVAVPTGTVVCSGGHASRFPQREEIGRVCNHSPSLAIN